MHCEMENSVFLITAITHGETCNWNNIDDTHHSCLQVWHYEINNIYGISDNRDAATDLRNAASHQRISSNTGNEQRCAAEAGGQDVDTKRPARVETATTKKQPWLVLCTPLQTPAASADKAPLTGRVRSVHFDNDDDKQWRLWTHLFTNNIEKKAR